mgnify:CR=1 FL=1
MYNYNKLSEEFLQYKKFLGYKYKSDSIIIKEIVKYLNDFNINNITKEVFENYVRLNENLSQNTIARNISTFKEFCKYLKLQGINTYQIPNNIYKKEKRKYKAYIYTHDEIKKIYSNLDIVFSYHYSYYHKTIYQIIIRILYQTGMRIGEVLNLTIDDYDSYNRLFHLKQTKNNQERIIVLTEQLNNLINDYVIKFNYKFKLNNKLFDISLTSIENYFDKLLNLSKIIKTDNGPRIHDLRHTFIVHLIEKFINEGMDLNVMLPIIQAHIGHQSLNSLSYYFQVTNDLLNIVNKISEEKLGYLIPKMEGDEHE